MPEPKSPFPDDIAAYQSFIDGLVSAPGSMTYLAQVAEEGGKPKGDEFAPLFKRYTPKQYELLARFILTLRETAFHDFLVYLHDSGYTLANEGRALPIMPFSNPPYYDFTARANGAPWDQLGWSPSDE